MLQSSSTDVSYDENKNELRITSVHKCTQKLSLSSVLGAVTVAFLNNAEDTATSLTEPSHHVGNIPASLAFLALPKGLDFRQRSEDSSEKDNEGSHKIFSESVSCCQTKKYAGKSTRKLNPEKEKFDSQEMNSDGNNSLTDANKSLEKFDTEASVVQDRTGVMKLQLPELSSVVVKQEPIDHEEKEEEENVIDSGYGETRGASSDEGVPIIDETKNASLYVDACRDIALDESLGLPSENDREKDICNHHEFALKRHVMDHFPRSSFWCPLCKQQVNGSERLKDHIRSVHPESETAFQKCQRSPPTRSKYHLTSSKYRNDAERSSTDVKREENESKSHNFPSHCNLNDRTKNGLNHDEAYASNSTNFQMKTLEANEDKLVEDTGVRLTEKRPPNSVDLDQVASASQTTRVCHTSNGWSPSRSVGTDGRKRDKKNFTCSHCETIIQDVPEFMRHVSCHRLQTNSPFSCPVCLKSFPSELSLRKHAVNHVVSKIYLCPFCNAEVSRSDNFKRHITMCHEPYAKQMLEHFDSRKYAIATRENDGRKRRCLANPASTVTTASRSPEGGAGNSGFLQYYMHPSPGSVNNSLSVSQNIPLAFPGSDLSMQSLNFSYYQMLKLALDQERKESPQTSALNSSLSA